MFDVIKSEVLHQGPSYSFSLDTVTIPGNREIVIEQLHHPGGVAILAVDAEGRIAMEKQYRFAVKETVLEIPAGKLDKVPGETPEKGALRELREETGRIPDSLIPLGEIYPSPGVSTERLHLFFATGLHTTEQELDDDEVLSVFWMTQAELEDGIAKQTIKDAKTICAYTLAKMKGLLR